VPCGGKFFGQEMFRKYATDITREDDRLRLLCNVDNSSEYFRLLGL
jgi:hypothetical protein